MPLKDVGAQIHLLQHLHFEAPPHIALEQGLIEVPDRAKKKYLAGLVVSSECHALCQCMKAMHFGCCVDRQQLECHLMLSFVGPCFPLRASIPGAKGQSTGLSPSHSLSVWLCPSPAESPGSNGAAHLK
jgi:hypothetical protein